MSSEELNNLIQTISSDSINWTKEDEFDYEGYTLIRNAKMTKAELKKALTIIWDICMNMTQEERDSKYLFGNGLIKSKDIFMRQRENKVEIPQEKVQKFREKLEAVKPLVDFLLKMKEVV